MIFDLDSSCKKSLEGATKFNGCYKCSKCGKKGEFFYVAGEKIILIAENRAFVQKTGELFCYSCFAHWCKTQQSART